jgi:hypothetical protein
MGRLNLAEIQPGMTLAADVLDRNGRVLLKTGLTVNDKHLKILKQWGVTDADIQGVSREEITTAAVQHLDQGALARTEERLHELFRNTDREHPFIKELFRLSVLRQMNQMQGCAR